jgi:hypothetical protein
LTGRGRTKGWTTGRAALLFTLALVSTLMLAGYSAAANQPDREALTRSPDQMCVHAGLTLPTIVDAYMINPGQRQHADAQGKRVMQEIDISAQYPEMPQPECADYKRLGRAEVQMRIGKVKDTHDEKRDGWADLLYRSWIYSRTKEGSGGVVITPTGHEPASYYWKPGEVVRAKFDNIVKFAPTGKTFTSKTKTVRVEIRGGTSNRQALAARSHTSLSWTLPHAVSEGALIPFSWTGSHLGRNHRLVVQRPVGTARTWRSIMRLPSNNGSAELPGMPLGKYRLRLADLSGHRVLAQQVAGIGVFGQVPFSTLFRGGYLPGGDLESGVYATPSSSFPYVGGAYVGDRGRPNTVFSVSHNRCSAVHIGFVLGETPGEGYSYPDSIYSVITLVQQSRDSVTSEVPLNGIGTVDAELVPGQTWSMLAVENNRDGKLGSPTVYFNGYAVCDSTESFFR